MILSAPVVWFQLSAFQLSAFAFQNPCNQSISKRFKTKNFRSSSPSFCALCALLRLIPSQVQISAIRFQISAFILLGRLSGRPGTPFGTGKPSRNPCIHWSGTAGRVKRGGSHPPSPLNLNLNLSLNLNRPVQDPTVQPFNGSMVRYFG